ncbi:RHS repeat-associated core domain-containing protein [Erwinia pyrifoliae]|uniref:RHS repeat-associated core domain-containing protein n=1 Tax=Erwinia pyrifoliae TaxID=79967 RepID=UPI00223B856F|nr:RHS repeat-associated core domain-containing protein [Erwinia pyrifoliae]MCT2388387.1 type IV secretion protein Rhs [Erwinia pyrifoliae]MCU8586557.1 type IV secretion protein Rhs [Erwinia pyrifoliae]
MKEKTQSSANFNVNIQQDNFISACMTGVDPRTGVFSNSTTLFDYSSCFSDARFSFVLNYNSKNMYSNQGYGYGFTDNLSRYDEEKKLLSLSSGQIYKIANDPIEGQPEIADCKYSDFTFKKILLRSPDGAVSQKIYYIMYMNGVVEKLENVDINGDEQTCYVPSVILYGVGGEIQIFWDYNNGIPQLRTVRENKKAINTNTELLSFGYDEKENIKIQVFEDTEYSYSMSLILNTKTLLIQIKNTGLDIFGEHSWKFKYSNVAGKNNLLEEIRYPSGRKDTIEYKRSENTFSLTLPEDSVLYCVWLYQIIPQFMSGIKQIATSYIFNWAGDNDHYSSVEGFLNIRREVIKKIIRTYNKFHLLISERIEAGMTVKHVSYTYNDCDETKTFVYQSPKYQCINKIRTTFTDNASANVKQRDEVVSMEYDEYGNLVKQENDNNTTFLFIYTNIIRRGQQIVETPNGYWVMKSTSIEYPGNVKSNIRKDYIHELFTDSVNGSDSDGGIGSYKIVPIEEELFINHVLVNTTSLTYHWGLKDNVEFGKLKSHTLHCFDRKIVKSFKWDYLFGKLVLRTRNENDDLYSFETVKFNGVTGLIQSSFDGLSKWIEYTRDNLGRIILVTLTSNFDDQKKKKTFQYSYKYKFKEQSGTLNYEVETKDLYGNKIYERYDGLGRMQTVAILKNNSDKERIIHSYKYNELSQLVHEDRFSYKGNEKLSLINIYSYDPWGNINKVRHDDGVEENIVSDVVNRTVTHWLSHGNDSINKTMTEFDINNQPVIFKRYSLDDQYTQLTLERDASGRVVNKKDELGRITHYGYDLQDRVNIITLPDHSVITKSYNKYSEEQLIEQLTFTSFNGKEFEIGTQTFDALNRLKESQAYGVTTKYHYNLDRPLPDEITFADGTTILYENDYGLKNKILSITDKEKKFRNEFLYSYIDDSLIETKYISAHDTYIEKITEDTENSSLVINTTFTHDNNSIDITYKQENYINNDGISKITDENNTEYVYTHDKHGRLTEINSGKIKTEILYDKFSRIGHITESDELGKSALQLVYDEFGREIQRRVALSLTCEKPVPDPFQSLNLLVETMYYANNLIKSRVIKQLKENVEIIRIESFIYDELDRIKNYQCRGDVLTTDKSGKGIRAVAYAYDEVGNICEANSTYVDNSHGDIKFFYDKTNPFLLRRMYNTSTLDFTDYEFSNLGYLLRKKHTQTVGAHSTKAKESIYYYDSSLNLSTIEKTSYENNVVRDSYVTEYKFGNSNKVLFKKILTEGKKTEEISTFRGNDDEIINMIDFKNKMQYQSVNFLHGEAKQINIQNQNDLVKKKIITNNSGTPFFVLNFNNGKYQGSAVPTTDIYGSVSQSDLPVGINGYLYDAHADGYLLGSRLYDAENKRFTTPDNLSPFNGGNLNPYIYCNNNPVNNDDKSGYLTNQHWKIPVYIAGSLSIVSGIATLGGSLAMSSVMMTVFSIFEIGAGILGIKSIQGDGNEHELAIGGVSSSIGLGISLLHAFGKFRYPLSKSLKRFFDFNKSQQTLRNLSFDKKKKEIMGLKYLGYGVSVFDDTYKNKPRLNIYSHGKKTSLIETRLDNSGKLLQVNKLDYEGLDQLLGSIGGINYDNYASIRIIACHSADFGFLTPPLGYDMHQITGLPVKAFQGTVTSFGYPPEILQSSFEKFAHDPHAMQNILKQFASRFEIVHNANYSPKHFS